MAVALRADPEIRRNYQFIAYQYPTGYPLALLHAHLRKVMAEFWIWFDARAPEARQRGYVAVGHSMGGLLIKSLAVSSERQIWDVCFARTPAEVDLSGRAGELLRRMTLVEPDPKLARLVFLAVPHRGSPWSTGAVKAISKAMYTEDPSVQELREAILGRYGDQLRKEFRDRIAQPRASIDNLDPNAPYLRAFAELELRPELPYHSIIGDIEGDTESPAGDGVVPYQSAHLEGATSELIVKSGHDVQRKQPAIAELRRILLLHMEEANR